MIGSNNTTRPTYSVLRVSRTKVQAEPKNVQRPTDIETSTREPMDELLHLVKPVYSSKVNNRLVHLHAVDMLAPGIG